MPTSSASVQEDNSGQANPERGSKISEASASLPKTNSEKRARVFNVEELYEEARRTAEKYSSSSLAREEEQDSDFESGEGGEDNSASSSTQAKSANVKSNRGDTNADGISAGFSGIDDDDDDDDLMPPLPPTFFKKPELPTRVPEIKAHEFDPNEDEDDEDFVGYANEGVPVIKLIPTACEAVMQHGKKPMAVTAACFDAPGTRFLVGGYDCGVSMFEFQRMDRLLKADRTVQPCEGNVIHHVSFSQNGEHIIVCNGSPQVMLLDRRGTVVGETVRGDQYLVDLAFTKGHTATVMCCVWNPMVKGEFLTCSDDGSLRFWHLDDFKEITKQINKQRKIIKVKNANGRRAGVVSCAISSDARLIAAGCTDGSLQVWKDGKIMVAPFYLVRKAHNGDITSVKFSPDNQKLLTRGIDGTLKLWSLQDKKAPLCMKSGLPTDFRESDCGWSPRAEVVYVTCSPETSDGPGSLQFFQPNTFDLVYKIEYPGGVSAIRCVWHTRMNQILVTLSDGSIRIYYDPSSSHLGILQCVTKPVRRPRAEEVVKEEMILAPLTLDMFQGRGEEPQDKEVTPRLLKKYLRMKDNEIRPAFRKPADLPISGPSTGGRVNATGGTIHSYIAQQMGKERNREFLNDDDVRASILRHAEAAEAEPLYINKAYIKTQPKPIFQEKTTAPEEEEGEEDEAGPSTKRPRFM